MRKELPLFEEWVDEINEKNFITDLFTGKIDLNKVSKVLKKKFPAMKTQKLWTVLQSFGEIVGEDGREMYLIITVNMKGMMNWILKDRKDATPFGAEDKGKKKVGSEVEVAKVVADVLKKEPFITFKWKSKIPIENAEIIKSV